MSDAVGPEGAAETPRTFLVPPGQAGRRLDHVLAALTAATRSHIKVLIDRGRVRVWGEVRKAGYLLRAGDEVEVLPLPAAPAAATPQEIPLSILYEDEHLAALNKPPGMVVHPAPGQWQGTVVNALLFRWGRVGGPDALRPGIVHRLDKDTSGVLLIAKDPRTLERLGEQFKQRQVHKVYMAVVQGQPPAGGEIVFPIGRHPVERKKMAVRAGGRAATTRYRVAATTAGVSLVRLFPETGRTHQLRVHLAAVGHPIVGDAAYGPRTAPPHLPDAVRTFPRQALHARSIRFSHPISGATLHIRAPYPPDFLQLLRVLGFPAQDDLRGIESP